MLYIQLGFLEWFNILVSFVYRAQFVRITDFVKSSSVFGSVFNVPTSSIDCVKLLNEEHWVSAGEDGHLAVWAVTRKKPLALVSLINFVFRGLLPLDTITVWRRRVVLKTIKYSIANCKILICYGLNV